MKLLTGFTNNRMVASWDPAACGGQPSIIVLKKTTRRLARPCPIDVGEWSARLDMAAGQNQWDPILE